MSNLTQVYPKGWQRLQELLKDNPAAAGLYLFFAHHLDPACGAVVCSRQLLADQFSVSRCTISRWLAYLEKTNALIRIPVAGGFRAYALDPQEVWKGNTSKKYAAFITRKVLCKSVLVGCKVR